VHQFRPQAVNLAVVHLDLAGKVRALVPQSVDGDGRKRRISHSGTQAMMTAWVW